MKQNSGLLGFGLTTIVILIIGTVILYIPGEGPEQYSAIESPDVEPVMQKVDPHIDPRGHESQARKAELDTRFQQAIAMLHANEYEYAVKALHRVLELSSDMPEAHVNMGYALIGLKEHTAARGYFNRAIDIKPMQINAYYGLALAYEGEDKLHLAISAMESFIHISEDDNPFQSKARAAVWEWNERIQVISDNEVEVPSNSHDEVIVTN